MSIGTLIRKARLASGMSQNELAAASGVPKSRISRYENDWVLPTIDTIEALADAIGVSPKRLVGWR